MPGEAPHRTVTITNRRGLHARASAKFVNVASQFDAIVHVTGPNDGEKVVGTSIMGLMMLAAGPGSHICIEASGPQAQEVVNALATLVEDKFDED
ncbi:HPr family phosphocarrier protein [Emcibacter sp. SYSU 3D8]|uniref:HPr family phosphocarrier protein n=1 Tax=Emcibacter sp. SYSU 3D8 TaxID=3133969 RepID=UPI0031FE958B